MLAYYSNPNLTDPYLNKIKDPPLLCLATCGEYPPQEHTLNRFSMGCCATATALLVGGIVGVGAVVHSDLPTTTKAGVCVGGALVALGGYLCCRLSSKYALAAFFLRPAMQDQVMLMHQIRYGI